MKKYGWMILVSALAACSSTPVSSDGILLTGMWGSDQGRLTATQTTVRWTGACGSGSTSKPIMLDKHGRFDIEGVYTAGSSHPARYKGETSPGRVSLTVKQSDTEAMVGPLVLDLNSQATVGACR
jgi:hypothetical protein